MPSPPNHLYRDEDDFDRPFLNGWGNFVYEYDPKSYGALYPHVILLSNQHHQCKGDEILRGELEVIITAMRNRAIQQKGERDQDDDDYDNTIIETSEEALQFPNEHRFPVAILFYHASLLYVSKLRSTLLTLLDFIRY